MAKMLWRLTGAGSDEGNSIIQAPDGGYWVAGVSESDDGDITNHHGQAYYSDGWISKNIQSRYFTMVKNLWAVTV